MAKAANFSQAQSATGTATVEGTTIPLRETLGDGADPSDVAHVRTHGDHVTLTDSNHKLLGEMCKRPNIGTVRYSPGELLNWLFT